MDKRRLRNLLRFMLFLVIGVSVNAQELEFLNKWVERDVFDDFWVSTDRFVLVNNQLLYFTGKDWESRRYRIVNYRTGSERYAFSEVPQFWSFQDQYGKYVFLEREKELVLFDAITKREYQSFNTLKRNNNVYFQREGMRDLLSIINLNLWDKSEQVVDLDYQELGFFGATTSYRQLLLNLDEKSLFLESADSSGSVQYVLKLSSDGRAVNSIKRSFIELGYPALLLNNYYLGLKDDPEEHEEVYVAYPVLADAAGMIIREYRGIRVFGYHTPFSKEYANSLYLVSPDKRSVIFFDRDVGDQYLSDGYGSREIGIISVYRTIYGDEVGKSCVAVRPIELKRDASLTSSVVKAVTSTERMQILNRSTKKAKVGDIESYWYQVSLGVIKGWVLGKDIDILAESENVVPGVVNDTNVRLREKPDLQGKQLQLLERNTRVEVLEETLAPMKVGAMEAVWYRVKLEDGTIGWMYGHFLELE